MRGDVDDRKPFPVKPLLVFVAVIAAVRLSLSLLAGSFLPPSLLAAALFLYAPLPLYWRRGFPAWARAADPGGSVAFFALLAGAGAIAFFLFVRLPRERFPHPAGRMRRNRSGKRSTVKSGGCSANPETPRP